MKGLGRAWSHFLSEAAPWGTPLGELPPRLRPIFLVLIKKGVVGWGIGSLLRRALITRKTIQSNHYFYILISAWWREREELNRSWALIH